MTDYAAELAKMVPGLEIGATIVDAHYFIFKEMNRLLSEMKAIHASTMLATGHEPLADGLWFKESCR